MVLDTRAAVARRFLDEGLNRKNAAQALGLLAADVRLHSSLPTNARGIDAARFFLDRMAAAFPDLHLTVEDTISEWDKVVIRWRCRGTNRGALSGFMPTGKTVEFTGIMIFRVLAGTIREIWIEFDVLGIFQQLGLEPSRKDLSRERPEPVPT